MRGPISAPRGKVTRAGAHARINTVRGRSIIQVPGAGRPDHRAPDHQAGVITMGAGRLTSHAHARANR